MLKTVDVEVQHLFLHFRILRSSETLSDAQMHSERLRNAQRSSETRGKRQQYLGKLKILRGTSETLRATQERSGKLRNAQ